jgi:hypothetical protein
MVVSTSSKKRRVYNPYMFKNGADRKPSGNLKCVREKHTSFDLQYVNLGK